MRVAFAEFVLDTGTRQLLHAGAPVHLSPKAFDVLAALIEARPEALGKEALLQRVWPDTYVQRANLTNLVAEIRQALRDPAERPRFIRTVSRFGYAFLAEGSSENAPAPAPPPAAFALLWKDGSAPLSEGDHVLGRDPDLPISLPALTLSRRHACLHVRGTSATIEDLGSKNGTFLNGCRVMTPAGLKDGDEIRVGSLVLVFRLRADPRSTLTHG